ncbi:hypothetical protein DPMN_108803 [Dreissena polymorpha]|uniref:Uncharacterized protein n=1 Tax=Dreissena polymorpha TaxID=45954 RepID=A0A9D4QMF1_DREPO|nr:hypothetical protein DPMN_108803 [Dreissena polymorpha]
MENELFPRSDECISLAPIHQYTDEIMSIKRTEQPSHQQIAPVTDLDRHKVKCTNEATPQPDPQGVFTPTL